MWFWMPLPRGHVTRRMHIANFAFKMTHLHCFHPLLSNYAYMDLYTNSTFKVQKRHGLGSRDPILGPL